MKVELFINLKTGYVPKIFLYHTIDLLSQLYIDYSPVGTQVTVVQRHTSTAELLWHLVNHKSRS